MEKTRTIIMLVISLVICALFTMEVFAAVNINLTIGGTVRYTAKDIGAEIAGTIKVNSTGQTGEEKYMTLSNENHLGSTDNYGVFTIAGTGVNYSTNVLSDDNTNFDVVTDTIDLYVFVRNKGSRPFMPTIVLEEDTGLLAEVTSYYFATSGTNPIALIRSGYTAAQLCSEMDALTAGTDYFDFAERASISNSEVFFAKITLSIDPAYELDVLGATFEYLMQINIMLDIQYITNEDFLTIYQQNNITDPAWTKIGYNASLSATAIKANTNDITRLDNAYNAGINNNADLTQINPSLTYECDDYDTAVVYKDIDVVNVDISTGEIVGKLSDVNYPFEWYGGSVTLPEGAVLASGRVLEAEETFTVDVYTYYPTMYIRRWLVGDKTYVSITDKPYTHYGFIEIPEHYIATCEAVTYNPDKTIAYNDYGIITRSYVNGFTPYTDGANAYLENSGFTNGSSYTSTVEARPAAMLGFSNNLTLQWQTYAQNNPSMAQYTQKSVKGCAGQDWHEFVYQLLYLVKYANNNSQEMVGQGNCYTASIYSKIDNTNKAYLSEKVGGTIGLFDSNKNASNTSSDNLVFDNAHMAYANNNVTPYYTTDFLTYNKSGDNPKRILRDGYVGSNGYTSVACLGKLNPWGNVWNWVCGVAHINSNKKASIYVQLDEYDTTNYYINDDGNALGSVAAREAALLNMGYVKLSYTVPTAVGWYRYLGINTPSTENGELNGVLSLIGLPVSGSSQADATTGLCDQSATRGDTSLYIFGLGVGNCTDATTGVGLFSFSIRNYANHKWDNIGYRSKLINS